MVEVRDALEKRYSLGDTVSGIRSCHHFEPISTTSIKGKQLSNDHVYYINHSFSVMPTSNDIAAVLRPNDYATCIFGRFWWLVLVDLINVEEKDVPCKFMHPHGPTNNFHWPRTDDKGYVPFNKFIITVEIPQYSTNGRQFLIKEQELKMTNAIFDSQK